MLTKQERHLLERVGDWEDTADLEWQWYTRLYREWTGHSMDLYDFADLLLRVDDLHRTRLRALVNESGFFKWSPLGQVILHELGE